MEIEYNKKTKTITIVPLEELEVLDSPALYIDDVWVLDLTESQEYTFSSDGFYKVTVNSVGLTDDEVTELGYVLVIDYSKDKLRTVLIDDIEDERYNGLSTIYNKNKKIIRELEVSFYSGNMRRAELLMEEIKWL